MSSESMVLLFEFGSVAYALLRTDVLACAFMRLNAAPFESLPWLVCPMGTSVPAVLGTSDLRT